VEKDAPGWIQLGFALFRALDKIASTYEAFPSASYAMLENDPSLKLPVNFTSMRPGKTDMLDAWMAAATVFSTSTRDFNNRMGKDAQAYLGSAELAAVVSIKGELPTPEEYVKIVAPKLEGKTGDIYKYLNFHQMAEFSV